MICSFTPEWGLHPLEAESDFRGSNDDVTVRQLDIHGVGAMGGLPRVAAQRAEPGLHQVPTCPPSKCICAVHTPPNWPPAPGAELTTELVQPCLSAEEADPGEVWNPAGVFTDGRCGAQPASSLMVTALQGDSMSLPSIRLAGGLMVSLGVGQFLEC